ncbi:BTAD domain-containing putative transcriptional regulator [Streptomyces sp. S.PNR 29]|uniref:AfsR/SARP family transcriptional regulator n=1 Tax=Streptomyces sp. S.PNR 29 TaxID=2973805 RepID=UPI0025B036B5|nr:BTAD domain-containing putative transcriptional regulator [Streptomyces sp. S.PNR 29]MDN0198072.1 tetratricopeptide repeat protein [Streptomyces sp. S.PNR 29]
MGVPPCSSRAESVGEWCELRFGLLGPPVLYDGDSAYSGGSARVQPVGSAKMRALLAALLLEGGRVVSVEALKEALWGGAPPPSAQASLHNHVTRLRRLLDDPERLRTVPSGYLLRVREGELDVHVFEAQAAVARAAHAERDWARVVRACTAALALWRGTPLAGLPFEVGGYAFAQRLQEARLLLLEWRYDAELALGGVRLAELVPELTALAAEHPLRESYHRQLMLALHRTGRQAEALAVHRDLRTRLVEELGIEPGPAVREAHVEVLRGTAGAMTRDARAQADGAGGEDAGVRRAPAGDRDEDAGTRDEETVTLAQPPRPAQLPPPPAHFTGRSAVVEVLRRTLIPGPHPAVAVISGMAGVGKSALALKVAHELRERFPDGQLYVNLHGATPGMTPLTPGQALTALLRDLGADPRAIPEDPDAASALLRSLLAPTRTLMVLDDAAHAAQVRPLLPAGAGCAVIVTSRSPLTALDGAHRFPLAPLSDEDSAALLRAASGRDGHDGLAGLDAAHPLVELTGRLPLALRVVAARLAARHALTPDVLAGQLTATGGRLHHLEYDDLSVRRSLAVAHDALAASDRQADRDAALALRRIGALDLPTYGAPLLARLTDTDERRAETALDRLVDVALLEETAYGRYAPHDLVRDFARELALGEEDGGVGAEGRRRGEGGARAHADHLSDVVVTALRWYAAVAERTLTAIVEPGLDQDDRRRPTGAQPREHAAHVAGVPPFASPEAAFAWCDGELENVVALVERYAGHADDHTAACVSVLVRLLFPYVQRSGRVAEMEVLGRAALGVARRLGDEAAEAYALGDLAGLHFLTGRQNDALSLNDQALAIWRRLGVVSWIRRCLNNRGLLLEGLGRHAESGDALRQSLEYSRQLHDPYGEAVTYSHLGNLYEHTDPRAAIEQHRRSLAIGDEIGNVIVQHSAHCNIGYAHLTLGEPAAAAEHFEESLRILGRHGDWHGESQTRLGLVRALRLLGRTGRAALECAELLSRADARADRYMGGLARHQHGLLLRERGRTQEAYEAWRSALAALDGTDENEVVTELRQLLAGADGR